MNTTRFDFDVITGPAAPRTERLGGDDTTASSASEVARQTTDQRAEDRAGRQR